MKIGVCGSVDRLDLLETLGFDQMELNIGTLSTMDEAELSALKQKLEGRKILVKSGNCMFPGSVPPLYQDAGMEKTRAYLTMVMPKLKMLGITTAVFGSGGYRRMPEEVPQEKRRELLRDLLVVMEEEARKNGITVVVEPLNKKETNMLLTTAEAMGYIRELNLPNLKLLVDLYHFYCEGESLDRIREFGDYIGHIHIAEPTRRDFLRESDQYDYAPFFKALREIGYEGAVMFEGGLDGYDTGIRSTFSVLDALRRGDCV